MYQPLADRLRHPAGPVPAQPVTDGPSAGEAPPDQDSPGQAAAAVAVPEAQEAQPAPATGLIQQAWEDIQDVCRDLRDHKGSWGRALDHYQPRSGAGQRLLLDEAREDQDWQEAAFQRRVAIPAARLIALASLVTEERRNFSAACAVLLIILTIIGAGVAFAVFH